MAVNVINIQVVLDAESAVDAEDTYRLEFSDQAQCEDPDCDSHEDGPQFCESFFCVMLDVPSTGSVTIDDVATFFLCDACTLHVVRGNLAPLFEGVNG